MVLVYGGAFNPPSLAHFKIIKKLTKIKNVSKIIVVPVGNNYNKNNLVDISHRISMLNILVSSIDNVFVSDIENTNVFNGSINTLRFFEKNLNTEVGLVIGMDNLLDIEKWIEKDVLLSKYFFVIIKRKTKTNIYNIIDNLELKYNFKYKIINFNSTISSTKYRNNPKIYKKYIHRDVLNYIKNNNLYKETI